MVNRAYLYTQLRASMDIKGQVLDHKCVRMYGSVYMSRDVRKPVFGVSDQVRHKPACTATEDG